MPTRRPTAWDRLKARPETVALPGSCRSCGEVLPPARRSPDAPFTGRHSVRYPRAGVRQTEDGRWLLTLWDGDRIVHGIDQEDRTHDDRYTAFSQGWLTVGACWKAGTNLNGMATA